jgi:hypothetical protein
MNGPRASEGERSTKNPYLNTAWVNKMERAGELDRVHSHLRAFAGLRSTSRSTTIKMRELFLDRATGSPGKGSVISA